MSQKDYIPSQVESEALAELLADTRPTALISEVKECHVLLIGLQIAYKHPNVSEPMRVVWRKVGHKIQKELVLLYPALADFLKNAWQSQDELTPDPEVMETLQELIRDKDLLSIETQLNQVFMCINAIQLVLIHPELDELMRAWLKHIADELLSLVTGFYPEVSKIMTLGFDRDYDKDFGD